MRKTILCVLALLIPSVCGSAAETRFARKIIKLASPSQYHFFKLDDINYPLLPGKKFAVSSLVYRGTRRYYVEIGLFNGSPEEATIGKDFIMFTKPNYTVYRTDTLEAAADVVASMGGTFIPSPPPQVPPNTTTTYSGTATTYGNQTYATGTATTTPDHTAQAWANAGNAIGNALAARSFYKSQSREMKFATFLSMFALERQSPTLKPGEARIVVCTFEQVKDKKAPFEIQVRVSDEVFTFKYKE